MKKYLYWIHRPDHTDLLCEGYIGVSKNPTKRLIEHRSSKQNPHLTKAFQKYKDIVHTILMEGDEAYCYEIEEKLRPNNQIGWNIVKGGVEPPSWSGKNHSEETKTKISLTSRGISKPKPQSFGKNRTKEKNPMWGRKHSEETKIRMSMIKTNRHMSIGT